MAVVNFYMNPSGNNCNAGSTAADAGGSDSPSVTSTNGGWDSSTRVFTAASGTPFSGVSAGEFASITTDAATTTTYISKVTSVGGGGASVTLSNTDLIQQGIPSTSGTGRTCRIGGAWESPALWTSLLNSGNTLFSSVTLWLKAATYANTTTSRTINVAPSTSGHRFALVGYGTTPGDMDTQPEAHREAAKDGIGTDIPSVTFTTGTMSFNNSKITVRNIDWYASAATNAVVTANSGQFEMDRCRVYNNNANSASVALTCNGINPRITNSYLAATTTANYVIYFGSVGFAMGNRINGGTLGITNFGGHTMILNNVIYTTASHGIQSSGVLNVVGNTFINVTGNGIQQTGGLLTVINNLFVNVGGYDINIGSGDGGTALLMNNARYATGGSGHSNGIADATVLRHVTESDDPITNGNNLPPLDAGALSLGAGMPGLYEGPDSAVISSHDIGFQNEPATGGGGGTSGNAAIQGTHGYTGMGFF